MMVLKKIHHQPSGKYDTMAICCSMCVLEVSRKRSVSSSVKGEARAACRTRMLDKVSPNCAATGGGKKRSLRYSESKSSNTQLEVSDSKIHITFSAHVLVPNVKHGMGQVS